MKRVIYLLPVAMAFAIAPVFASSFRFPAEADSMAHATLARMTLDEKLEIIDGNNFDIRANQRLGLTNIHMSDGPVGVRGVPSTAYPASVMLAATWNRRLAHDYGYAVGRDSRARGVNIILGPGVNIYRSPLNSRNFEYMGEDPYLTSQMSGEYILGVQENPGVIACIKHFAANNPETGRYDVSSDVDERTLHEIYLPAFRHAVEQCGVGAIMSSYNRINGTWTSENRWLMHDVLRDMWHYPFLTMTDWGAAHHTDMIVKYGVDLEMPGGSVMTPAKVRPLLESGEVSVDDIDRKVLDILRTCYYFRLYDYNTADTSIALDDATNSETAYNVAKEGFVLLKNNNVLPIADGVKRLCIVGHNAMGYVSGGGSSIVTPTHKTSVFDALTSACKARGIEVAYENVELYPDVTSSCCYANSRLKTLGFKAEYYKGMTLNGNPIAKRNETEIHSPWHAKSIGNHNVATPFSARFETFVKVKEAGTYI